MSTYLDISHISIEFPTKTGPFKALALIHISEPTRPYYNSYAVFCLKKKTINN